MAWEKRKSVPKSGKKPAFMVSAQSSLFFISLPWPSTIIVIITDLPTISSTTGSQHNHQPTTKSHRRFLSPLCSPSCYLFFFFLLPLPPATVTLAEASWATGQTSSAHPRPPSHATFSSLRCLLLLRRGLCKQNSFLHAVAE